MILELDYAGAVRLYETGVKLLHPSKGVWLEILRTGDKIQMITANEYRVWSFPTVIRPINVGNIIALQLENVRHQLAPLYERDDVLFDHVARMDVRNRLAWNGVPWDADTQLFGSGSPNLMRTASGAGLWVREQKAHRVLPLPE